MTITYSCEARIRVGGSSVVLRHWIQSMYGMLSQLMKAITDDDSYGTTGGSDNGDNGNNGDNGDNGDEYG